MNKKDKIFIAGATGMVGNAIVRNLCENGYTNIIGSFHKRKPKEQEKLPVRLVSVDFKNQDRVNKLFKIEKPDYVFLAAAKVGGIYANNTYPAQFIYDNLSIQNNIIHASYENDVQRLLFLGSSCIYPKNTPQPMKEEHLLTGVLEPTNEPYAIAKIAGIKMCEAYNREYGTQFVAVMPTNLYGPNDNFDLENSHVLPALIRKFHKAKLSNKPFVEIWGTGTPRREFLHVNDMADGCVHVMNMENDKFKEYLLSYPKPCFLNLGTGIDCTIKELASTIKEIVGFKGDLMFDENRPDGTMYKCMDVSLLNDLGWDAQINLKEGIRQTYKWYLNNVRQQDVRSLST